MNKTVVDILRSVGAVITNSHIVLTSGRHTDSYINPDLLLPNIKECKHVGKLFAEKFKNKKIDVVIGPAIGGIIFSQWTAYYLSRYTHRKIVGIFTEKTPDNNQVFERGFETYVRHKRVLVVEDVTATGSSIKKVIRSVRKEKGIITGVCVMINRDPDRVNSKTLGAPFCALETFQIDSHDERNCPLCKKQIPINIKVGHGKEFLAKKKQ